MQKQFKICILFWLALLACNALPARAQTIAIKAGKLVHPETGTIATNQIILVENSKVNDVGANLTIPGSATVIDLSNATVMPGLIE
ncbi:MAG: hypothetical protein ACE5I1_26795 [bacterium]